MQRVDGGDPAYLFGSLPVGVLVVDGQQRYTYANQPALDLLGYTMPELMQLRVPDLMTSSPRITEDLWNRYVKERSMTVERFELRHRDGHTVSVRINSSVLTRGPDDDAIYVAWLRPEPDGSDRGRARGRAQSRPSAGSRAGFQATSQTWPSGSWK